MSLFRDLFRRLRLSWRWILAQFVGAAFLVALALAWTRLPEKHVWQVIMTLLVPLLLLAAALVLQAGTMRRLADDEPRRVGLAWGAASLLFWIALAWAAWALLDWCDDQIPQWAGYLNSRFPANARATLFTYDHLQRWMTILEWILRWIVVPAKIIPYAAASALAGWRLPFRRALRILWNWRWWPAVVLAAWLSVWLPSHFFTALPHGTVHAQVWRIGFKLAGTYLLGVSSWVFLLAWVAVLFGRQQKQPPEEEAPVPALIVDGPTEGSLSAKAEPPLPEDADQTES